MLHPGLQSHTEIVVVISIAVSAELHVPGADAVGPAVSLDGYPRYKPQWGVGLPEQKKYVPPTPARREPSDRAKAVMTHPGTPGYPKGAAGETRAAANGPKAAPSGPKADLPGL